MTDVFGTSDVFLQKSADFLSAPLALTGHTWIWNWSYEQNK